jgi:hypothetical protein
MTSRRAFIFGLGASLAVIRTPGLLMPIKPVLATKMSLSELNHWRRIANHAIDQTVFGPVVVHDDGSYDTEGTMRLMDGFKRTYDMAMAKLYPDTAPLSRSLYQDREIMGKDWPWTVKVAPPSGFKIAST